MTVKKLWLLIIIFISMISIAINAFILTTLTDKYFVDYLDKNYQKDVERILQYTKTALLSENLYINQMTMELETHLKDPVVGIKLYSAKGDLLVNVSSVSHMSNANQNGGMMRRNRQEEVEEYKISNNGNLVGVLHISKKGSSRNSLIAGMFKGALIKNSLFAMLISLLISLTIGILISKKMSRELIETAELANDIQTGVNNSSKKSFILEIDRIRDSLTELNTRLKIKQKNRKELVDQLIHQTRTPLTILKSHLEGVEDGIIQMDQEEIGIWQNQINNITTIITNMSGMIDANKEKDEIRLENFEINYLIKQIVNGIKPQFDKKNISLNLLNNEKIDLLTDRYKLSQIIYNLLTNAYKYTPNNGEVKVAYFVSQGVITLYIEDNGIGIDKEDYEKIFNAYYRSSKTSQIEGDGIGLYVVRENLKHLQGNIQVKSEKETGTIFTINFPTKLIEKSNS